VLPSTCSVGQAFFKSNSTAGANWYACVAPNTWAVQSGGSSSGSGGGGGAISSSQITDFDPQETSGSIITIAPGVYRLGTASYAYTGSTTFTLMQYPITSVSQGSQATLTLSGNWTNGSLHSGDTIFINGATGTGCAGLNALQTIVNSPAQNQVTINWNSSSCAYTANSGSLGANPNAAGLGYLYGDYAGNLTLDMPASVGLIVVGAGAIVPITIQESTPGFATGSVPIATVAIGTSGNGNWSTLTDARAFMSTDSMVAGAGMTINEAGGVWTVGIDRSLVPELGAGNTWTGTNDFSAAASTAPMKVTGSAPQSCIVGQFYFSAPHTYACTAANTWTQVDGGSTSTIASGSATLGSSAIASGSCASAVTVSAPGVATTDTIQFTPNADITAVTGYAPVATGGLAIYPYPTSNNVNFKVCNPTGSSITPGVIALNWRVVR